MKQVSQKLIQIGAILGCIGLVIGALVIVNYAKAVTNNELYGYACNTVTGTGQFSGNTIGCISLSHVSATGEYATNTTHQVYFTRSSSTATIPTLGEFSGTGFNPRVGVVSFGQVCPNEPGFTTAMKTGKQCAKLLDVAGNVNSADAVNTGWGKFIYVGDITHTLGSEKLVGFGWQAYNTDTINPVSDVGIGKLDFSKVLWTKLGCTQSIATNYDSTATVNDNSCNFPSTCGPANGVVYTSSTAISGTGIGSIDLCGVNSTNIGTFTSTNPSSTTGTFTWDCKSITTGVAAKSCSATWNTTTTSGGEICGNGIDDNGNGQVDENCGGLEICTDGIDNDGDGLADNNDPDCYTISGEICGNGIDDNGNGQVDENCTIIKKNPGVPNKPLNPGFKET